MLLEQGVIRDTELSPELLQTSKDIADQMFLKLLRKEFREGSYYRTIIARFDTGAQASPAAQHALRVLVVNKRNAVAKVTCDV